MGDMPGRCQWVSEHDGRCLEPGTHLLRVDEDTAAMLCTMHTQVHRAQAEARAN